MTKKQKHASMPRIVPIAAQVRAILNRGWTTYQLAYAVGTRQPTIVRLANLNRMDCLYTLGKKIEAIYNDPSRHPPVVHWKRV